MNTTKKLALALAAACLAAGANASTVFSNDYGNVDMSTPNAVTASFGAGPGAGSVAFHLDGFNSLDGDNSYIDVFTLSVNGNAVFSGTWDLGGGGADEIFTAPTGYTLTKNGTSSLDITVPVSLASGSNTVTFAYDSPTTWAGSGRAGPQGIGDEGWGLGQVTVTATTVPEPASVALLLGGLGIVGGIARRRARKLA